jgi:large subunit ribosomal protein L5
MVDFFTRIITIVLPRVRDFNGIEHRAVDNHGILNVGFREQYVFPEVIPEESSFAFPLGVNIVPRLKKRTGAIERYLELGVPLKGLAQKSESKGE